MARPENVAQFILRHSRQWADIHAATGIPPSVLIAQSMLETGVGTSKVYAEGHNLFGFRYYKRHDSMAGREDAYVIAPNTERYAFYLSWDDSAGDYVWLFTEAIWSQEATTPFRVWAGYTAVIDAARASYGGQTDADAMYARARAVCAALGRSKFCEGGGYNNPEYGDGGDVYGLVVTYALIEFDSPIHITPHLGEGGVPIEDLPPGEYTSTWLEDKLSVVTEPAKAALKAAGDALQGAAPDLAGLGIVILAVGLLWAAVTLYTHKPTGGE